MKVIIAEDNKMEQRNICNLIENLELELEICAIFSNGRDALDYLSDNTVDIIISDIQMPHFNGIDLLKAINQKNITTKVIFVSCYDNPQYLMNAIQNNAASYILKPIKKAVFHETLTKIYNSINETKALKKQLETAEKLKKYANEKLIRDLIFNPSEVTKTDINAEFGKIKYALVGLIGIEDYNPYSNLFSNDTYEISMITRYISELEYDNIDFYTLLINAQSLAVLIVSENDEIKTDEIFKEICNYILTNFGIYVKIGISNTTKNLLHLSSLYKEASEALLYTNFEYEKNIVNYDNINAPSDFPFKFLEIVKDTEEMLKNPSEKSVNDFIGRYLDFSNSNGTYIQKFAYGFVNSIELNLNKNGKSLEDITGIEIWKKLSSYNSEANTKKLLYNIFFAACELLSDKEITGENNNEVVETIKTIIYENYQDKITTEYLSKKINYSQRYLSLIFKKETGKTILQFLTEYRIEKAKQLLKEKDSKIYTVANAVGYTRNSHFNNIFKKYVGISPYDYKTKYTEL